MSVWRFLRGFGGEAAEAAFSPSDLTDYVDHLIDTGLTHSGGTISQWSGEAGAVVLTQATASKEPAVALADLNGHDVGNPDGVDDWLGSDQAGGVFSTALTQPFTLYFIDKQAANDHDIIVASATDATTYTFGLDTEQLRMRAGGTSRTSAVLGDFESWHYHIVCFDGASSYWDRSEVNVLTGLDPGSSGMSDCRVFNYQGNTLYHGGKLAMMGFQNAAPTAQEKTDMNAWMKSYAGL